jgi:hypothetical protein
VSSILAGMPSRAGAIEPAAWSAWSPGAMRFDVERAEPSLLVVTDAFIDGWHATVDGRMAPQVRANGVGRALPLPPGRHTVEMWFHVPALWLAWLVSWLALAAAAVFAVGRLVRRLESPAAPR